VDSGVRCDSISTWLEQELEGDVWIAAVPAVDLLEREGGVSAWWEVERDRWSDVENFSELSELKIVENLAARERIVLLSDIQESTHHDGIHMVRHCQVAGEHCTSATCCC